MYLNKQGSTKRVIQSMYDVWLPPMPEKRFILGHELRKEDQMWRRPHLPKDYDERLFSELEIQKRELDLVDDGILKKVKHFDPVLEKFRRQEWHRRIYGVWFMNNGKPTYITGTHYFFLTYCKLDHQENDGYPMFYEPQLDRFYFRQLCMEDPFCHGYLFVGPRGGGKSAEEVACMLENMTKPGHNRHGAIQSKSEEDAKVVIFQEKMVPMFNNLPIFFKPQFSHGTEPKDKFIFRRKSDRSGAARSIKHGPQFELGNTIMCYPPQNKALDGKTLSDIINDEIGKLKPEANVDAYTRNGVNVRCVYRNKVKRGLIRATTTVEEMEQGGDECYEIWNESEPRVRDGNGYTLSKLYRYFISAIDTQVDMADKYGIIPRKKAMEIVLNERKPFMNDNLKLAPIIRKNPLSAEEAFIKDQSKSIYDPIILANRTAELEMLGPQKQPGRTFFAEWIDGKEGGRVELIEHPDGPFRFFYLPDEFMGGRKVLNATTSYYNADREKTLYMPANGDLWRGGCDPIKFVKTDDPRASKFACHGLSFFLPQVDMDRAPEDYVTGNIMFEYCQRHADPEIDYDNIIKIVHYLSMPILIEHNAGEFSKHFKSKGYEKFAIYRRDFSADVLLNPHSKNSLSGENPVHSSIEVVESYIKRTAAWIRRRGNRINSLRLLRQLSQFDPKKKTKFDLAVSFGYAILAMEADLEQEYDPVFEKNVYDFFNRFDLRGQVGTLITPKHVVTTSEDDEDDSPNDFDNPEYIYNLLYRT